jgi:hypothetical protein
MGKAVLVQVLFAIIILTGTERLYGNLPGKDSISFQYNLKEGQVYKVVYDMKNTMLTEMMGMSVDIKQDMVMYHSMQVSGPDDENTYTLLNTIDRISISQEIMGMAASYDSQNPVGSTDPMASELKKAFDNLVGEVITMRIDNKGTIIESDYVEVMSTSSMGGGFSLDNSQTWFTIFPEKKLIPGDLWETTITLGDEEYQMTSITEYALKSCSKKSAAIEFTTTFGSPEGSKMKDLSGNSTGKMTINPKTGLTIEMDYLMKLKITIEEEDLKIPLSMEVAVHMEEVK